MSKSKGTSDSKPRMKLFKYRAEVIDTITGMDLDDATTALQSWLGDYAKHYAIFEIEEIGEAW